MRALAIALALLAGCSAGDPGTDLLPPRLETGEEVTLQRIRAEPYALTYFSGLDAPARVVVRSEAEWERVWEEIWARQTPIPERPAVDFAREVVVVAAMGQRPSGGYTVLLERVVQRDGFVEIVVREASPGRRCATFDAFTQPVDVARMQRVGQPIRFRTVETVTECR